MKIIKSFFTITLLFLACQANAMNPNEYNLWYFGINAGLDFNSGTAVATTVSNFNVVDNSSVICDDNGFLLMYTNGTEIKNKNNQVMPNGTGLMGHTSGGQTALFVHQPESQLYYLFTVPEFASIAGLRYSIIDMNADSGRGDVVSKNNLLFSPSTEKLTAIYNSSDKSFWIISHKFNSNEFDCFKLNATGLNTVPVISAVGTSNTGGSYGYIHGAVGQLSISYQGDKLASAIQYTNGIEIFDFDINTGLISNPILIINATNSFGICFSPDGNKLYSTQWTGDGVYQYDLTTYTQSSIQTSKIRIGTTTSGNPNYSAGYLQMGRDGKIYVAKYSSSYLSVISSPNNTGSACAFVDNGISLGTASSQAGLTNVAVYPGSIIGIIDIDDRIETKLFPNPLSEYGVIQYPKNIQMKNTGLRVFDLLGRVYFPSFERRNDGIVFKRGHLVSGDYIYELLENNKIVSTGNFLVK